MRSIVPTEHIYHRRVPTSKTQFSELVKIVLPTATQKMMEGYNNIAANLTAFFGFEPVVDDLTPVKCLNFFVWLTDNKKPSTAKAYRQKFCNLLSRAYEQGQFPYDIKEFIEKSVSPVQTNTPKFLTREELWQIEKTPSYHQTCKDAFLLACNTGLKLADIENLRWEHIVQKGERLYITKKVERNDMVVNIPLSATAKAIVEHYRAEQHEETVFPIPSRTTMSTALRNLANDTGIDTSKMTFQVARYTFSALMLQAGADSFIIAKMSGTSNPYTKMPIELDDAIYERTIDLLDKFMEELK